jgi:hypothetical protein
MRLGKPARIVERAGGGDHLFHRLGSHAAPAVEHALDRCRANAGAACNGGEGRLGDGALPDAI